jgi:thiamine transporter
MFDGYEIVIKEYFLKLLEPKSLISVLAVIALAVIFFVISRKVSYNTKILAYGAIAIAASFVLSYIRLFRFPNGGSVTVASMLPLFIFAYIAGPRAGMMAGMCLGMLQFIQDAYFVHWTQFLLDYPIAFALLGLAGLCGKNIFVGAFLGSFGRFICHFLSGVVFFAEYAGEQNVFLYSLIYNGSYILPDMIICLAILAIPSVRSAITQLSQRTPRAKLIKNQMAS